MRKVGLIGGMSPESTALYYTEINREINARLGGSASAELLLYSVNFAEIVALQQAGDWEKAGKLLKKAAKSLKKGGAEAIVLCTNTMHKVADVIETAGLPLLHIADCTGLKIKSQGLPRVALLATRYTMEQDFYKGRLKDKFGIECLVPDDADRLEIHRIIYDELCKGIINPQSKSKYLEIMIKLKAQGAMGFILGCTEIGLLIKEEDSPLPLFDTTLLHAKAAVDWALTPQVI